MKKLVASIATGIIIAAASATSVSAQEYEVQEGDNLWSIADNYNTTYEDLVEINELKTTVIQPKQKLLINETYVVEKGDTLIGIAKEYDIPAGDIKEWNNLKSDVILIGQELEIKAEQKEQKDSKSSKAATVNESASKHSDVKKPAKQVKEKSANGKTITVTATAYTANCDGCSGITATGVNLKKNPNAKVIAVDPSVIPLGSKVFVEGYGYAIAADVGSAINGKRIDINVPTKKDAKNWGVRSIKVTILG